MSMFRRSAAFFAAVGLCFVAATAHAATNDPLRDRQWGLDQINAESAWSTSRGAGAVIAVVDTGVDLTHPDLANRLVPGATFVGCPGEATVCSDGNWKGADGVGQAPDIHGTHVASIAASVANNSVGVAGVAPDAKVMPIKVLEDGAGATVDIANGIRWAADHGADVINLSLGSLPGLQVLSILGLQNEVEDAIDYARDRGALTVIAAGNSSTIACTSPGFSSSAICVGSTTKNKTKSYFSELPIKPDLKAVTAPGGSGLLGCEADVWAAIPLEATSSCGVPGYDSLAGTSMATPHVAGVAALLMAQGRSVDSAEQAIVSTARHPLFGFRGVFTPLYGHGIVDAAAAVKAP